MNNWTSRLMIYDFDEGKSFPVLETDRLIEAPNWTPDGEALVVNGDGSLYWVDLETPALMEVDTGLCINLNNDHGISPDGDVLFFSDHTYGGPAQIWRQDLDSDDDPVVVTAKTPSWYHGISPDGRMITYTAMREGLFGIYTCLADGTQESCIIEGAHHYDGPDFTPDGQWIWFNSDRSGSSELWRVRPDGSDLERMTEDHLVNWFPHPAPAEGMGTDGAGVDRVVYLAFPEGTEGHPPGLHVSLRLWRTGQPIETLVELYGGQGTINVPSWAPDGRAFAYVEYAS